MPVAMQTGIQCLDIRFLTFIGLFIFCVLILAGVDSALAQQGTTAAPAPQNQLGQLSALIPEGDGSFTARIIQGVLLLTVLSLAPGLLITMTCFTRFIVAFSFLRSGMGLQSTPSNLIVISLSLFMTFFIMEPVFKKSWNEGVTPLMDNQMEREEAFDKITLPLKDFMLKNIRPQDLALFEDFRNSRNAAENKQGDPAPSQNQIGNTEQIQTPGLGSVIPAFMLSELRRGFEIGFLILLPFLVIDLVVAIVTMSMGMMMLPPTVVALPFKVLFFVLIDGWHLLVGQLLQSVNA